MNHRLRVASLATATALLGSGIAVVASAPAHAADVDVAVTSWTKSAQVGKNVTIKGTITDAEGDPVTTGIAGLARKVGNGDWQPVKDDQSPQTFRFTDKPTRATSYRVVYADQTGTQAYSSVQMHVKVHRAVGRPRLLPRKGALAGPVKPAYKHSRVVIQERAIGSGPWERVKVVKTNAKSHWVLRVPKKYMHYRAVVRASHGLAWTASPGTLVRPRDFR